MKRIIYTEEEWQRKRARVRILVFITACVAASAFVAATYSLVHT